MNSLELMSTLKQGSRRETLGLRDHRVERGLFITIEGIHGAGKSSVSKMLLRRLEGLELRAQLVVDQAGTAIGKRIREINLEEERRIDALTEALLIAAARRQNILEIIKPSLSKGEIVVCERYNDAYFAFQVFARGLPQGFIECVSSTISEGIRPALTILMDLEPDAALARLKRSSMHRIEKEPVDFHKKVRQGYLSQAKKHSNRTQVVDAGLPQDEVVENVWQIVHTVLTLRRLI